MDYIFHKSLSNSKIWDLVISYDIACQWSIHLNTWLQHINSNFSDKLFNDQHMSIKLLVPKFHLPAHIAHCRSHYSFNYSKHVGRTDGEAPECGWAEINPIASSTKEMGPGYRRDTLDSHFNDYNWQKIISLGKSCLMSSGRDNLFPQVLHYSEKLKKPAQTRRISHSNTNNWRVHYHRRY